MHTALPSKCLPTSHSAAGMVRTVIDTLRGYVVEFVVYLYLLSIMPLQGSPLKPAVDAVREAARDPSATFQWALDAVHETLQEPSEHITKALERLRERVEPKSPFRPAVEAVANAWRDYEQRQKEADLATELAWRELIETSEHHVH